MSDEDSWFRVPGCTTLVLLFLVIGLAIRLSIMIDTMEKTEDRLDKIEETLKLETKDGDAEKEADESEGGLDLQKAD